MTPADLLYSVTETETLVFAPRELAEEVRRTRAALAAAQTWGDARRALSPERYREMRGWLLAQLDPEPDDDEAFPGDELPGHGAWPRLFYSEVGDWLPAEVFTEYGVRYDGLFDSGVDLPADAEAEILEALRARGIRCQEDADLEELFGGGYVD